ncbi:hypothetical protein Tco_0608386 [Tanacetum coccineum]
MEATVPEGMTKGMCKLHALNSQIRTLGPDAYTMTWEMLKKKMTDKADTDMYQVVSTETKKMDKYISGLPDNVYGNVKSSKPKTLDETIELANELMDQKLRIYAERQTDNKRKADDLSRNNHSHQQKSFKKQNVAKTYAVGSGEEKEPTRTLATLMMKSKL